MYRSRPVEDPVRRWRRCNRIGRRLALAGVALWFPLGSFLLGVAPAPEPLPRESPPRVEWWPEGTPPGQSGESGVDIRTLWSPSAFALPTPAGFSHSLRRGRSRLAPPIQTFRPDAAYLEADLGGPRPHLSAVSLGLKPPPERSRTGLFPGVFPPRSLEAEMAQVLLPNGWESRLFSGMDLNFGGWTNQAWTARMEMRFDAGGVPHSMLLVQSSGLPEVDRRLVRSAQGWRLLEPAAPRSGLVGWSSPAPLRPQANPRESVPGEDGP